MSDFKHGPVEFYLLGFPEEQPGSRVVDALLGLLESKTVRLIDLLFVSRATNGELTVRELEELADEWQVDALALDEPGLVGDEDIDDLSDAVEPGTSAAILVIEHTWALPFAEALADAGGSVLYTDRIPAPVVNELAGATRP